jgi:hypothetical protein
VRRRGVDQPHGTVLRQLRGVQPQVVHRHGQQLGARGLEAAARCSAKFPSFCKAPRAMPRCAR